MTARAVHESVIGKISPVSMKVPFVIRALHRVLAGGAPATIQEQESDKIAATKTQAELQTVRTTAETAMARAQQATAETQRDTALAQRDAVLAQRDAALSQGDAVRTEQAM